MIENLAGLLSNKNIKIGDKVKVKYNHTGHSYQIGMEFYIASIPSPGIAINYVLRYNNGTTGNYISLDEFETLTNIKIEKESFIRELENIIEFSRDFDFNEDKDFEKSYKIFQIFKEIKSASTDAEKLEVISRYIK